MLRDLRSIVLLLALALCAVASPALAQAPATTRATASTKPHNFARWEKAIAAIEAKDRENPPPRGGIVFIGSSTIARWKDVDDYFPGYHIINRGFGGSEIIDSAHFADRLLFPIEPKMIFLRAGTNDIHAGRSAQAVFEDFKTFEHTVHAKLPETKVLFIGNCPAPVRWNDRDETKKLNELVAEYAKNTPNVAYIDAWDISLTADGKPREELFVKDRLHPNAQGYKLLAERIRPYLPKQRE
jgi:lysophospholipase L1-like esterase